MLSKNFIFFSFLFALLVPSLQAQNWEVIPHCDIPTASLKELKTSSLADCQASCSENKDCKAALYVTAWNKCALKADGKKHASLRFLSGELNEKREYRTGTYKVDQDHSGKDMQRLVVGDADQCGNACTEKAGCAAFTYLEGYRVCWLKKAGGKLSSKIFSCSIRKT